MAWVYPRAPRGRSHNEVWSRGAKGSIGSPRSGNWPINRSKKAVVTRQAEATGSARAEPSPHGCPSLVPAGARKPELPPGLVDDHGDRVREVQAAALGRHREAEYPVGSELGEEVFGQAAGLGAEQQGVSGLVLHGRVRARPSGREREEACRLDRGDEALQGLMAHDPGPFPIVEASSPELCITQCEPERCDEVQGGAGIGAKPDNITGIGRDLRLE
jgi:hypothetical protein